METILTNIVAVVNDVLWNKYLVLLFLLLGSGVFFSIRTGFVQVRKFGEGMRLVFGNISLKGKDAGKDGMSSFQALATAIAAQVGTGNIAGCASALVSGGPGAVFWMWVSAFFGMATIYGEAVLAQKYKTVGEDGAVSGGPIYYIKAAFKGKLGTFMAGFFAVAIILALGFMGNMVQSNSIGDAFFTAFGIPKIATGIVIAAIAAFIFLGGVKRIASITEKLVPIMAIFYICGSLVAICMNAGNILPAFRSIFVGAFTPQAVMGGAIGISIKEAVRFGVWEEACHFCGQCVLGSTGAICPISQCAKSLVNGPCGGQKNGKCEVNPENDCAWIKIYERLQATNQLEKLSVRRKDKGYGDFAYPRTISLRGKK